MNSDLTNEKNDSSRREADFSCCTIREAVLRVSSDAAVAQHKISERMSHENSLERVWVCSAPHCSAEYIWQPFLGLKIVAAHHRDSQSMATSIVIPKSSGAPSDSEPSCSGVNVGVSTGSFQPPSGPSSLSITTVMTIKSSSVEKTAILP